MLLRWMLAAVHLLGVALSFTGIVNRAAALRGPLDGSGLRRLFRADTVWGLSALVMISTGLLRVFTSVEKGSEYYLASFAFWHKMGLLAAILLLELWPMVVLIRWRVASARGVTPDTSPARTFFRISVLQAVLLALMVFAATAMARGMGY
jgi:putative membrane protein